MKKILNVLMDCPSLRLLPTYTIGKVACFILEVVGCIKFEYLIFNIKYL